MNSVDEFVVGVAVPLPLCHSTATSVNRCLEGDAVLLSISDSLAKWTEQMSFGKLVEGDVVLLSISDSLAKWTEQMSFGKLVEGDAVLLPINDS